MSQTIERNQKINYMAQKDNTTLEDNKAFQGNDKDPANEKGRGEQVTKEDLTGKKVDADLSKEEEKPNKI